MYKITKGQLITMWVFVLLLAFVIFMDSAVSEILAVFFILMPFALIFYTISWRNYRKKLSKNKND